MAFAGLFDATHYTVITCAAAPRMAAVHSRMPVILPAAAMAIWLNPDHTYDQAASVMVPYLSDDLRVEKNFSGDPAVEIAQADLFT